MYWMVDYMVVSIFSVLLRMFKVHHKKKERVYNILIVENLENTDNIEKTPYLNSL